jgi:DNA-binding transcriptional ArsR family regulator
MLNRMPADLVFQALGDHVRRAIVARLSQGEASMGEIAADMPITLSAIHQHLAVLQRAELVECEKRGRRRVCRLRGDGFDVLDAWIRDHRRMWNDRLVKLAQHLSEEPK